MISVVVAKKKPKYGFMPLTYMWCAQTMKAQSRQSREWPQTIIGSRRCSCGRGTRYEVGNRMPNGRRRDDVDLGVVPRENQNEMLEPDPDLCHRACRVAGPWRRMAGSKKLGGRASGPRIIMIALEKSAGEGEQRQAPSP